MTSPTPRNSPIPKQPIGVTFVVAMSVLGFFLIVQVAAVIGHFLPKIRQTVVESAVAASVPPAASATSQQQPSGPQIAGTTQQQQPLQPRLNQEVVLRLVTDSDRAYRIGDFDAALKGLNDADAQLPDDPGILLRRARLYESMAQLPEAVADYERVLSLPGLDPANRSKCEKKLSTLSVVPVAKPATKPTQTFSESAGGADVRDDIGLQPGSSLGIVDARLRDGTPGTKVLRIAIKARPGLTIDTRKMKLHVFFYEKDETGEVMLTESKVVSQWISPPVDWKDNEPELLDVTYTLPESGPAAGSGTPGRQFVGYIVGIYYTGELQDTRADPGPLVKKFPLPLYLKQESQ